jgi:prephenate dehydrogenase
LKTFAIPKLVIVGVGLIGGSLALALKRAGVVGHVVGVGRSPSSLARAAELGVIDSSASLEEALQDASMVVLCAPVAQTFNILHAMEPHLQPGTIVTDAGSTKGDVIVAAKTALGDKVVQFVPAHPIAGRELSGVDAALPDLYDGKRVVLCPLQENLPPDVQTVRRMWETAGAACHVMPAVQHDAIFAAVSHLPHLLAFALVAQVVNAEDSEAKLAFAGSGFRDTTRIAASSPEMWRDICIGNRSALLSEVTTYQAVLAHLKDQIEGSNDAALEKFFRRASDARHAWGAGHARVQCPPDADET